MSFLSFFRDVAAPVISLPLTAHPVGAVGVAGSLRSLGLEKTTVVMCKQDWEGLVAFKKLTLSLHEDFSSGPNKGDMKACFSATKTPDMDYSRLFRMNRKPTDRRNTRAGLDVRVRVGMSVVRIIPVLTVLCPCLRSSFLCSCRAAAGDVGFTACRLQEEQPDKDSG